MSWEAWGTPPDKQEPPQRCPVCDGEWHAEDCELGQEVSRRLSAEAEVARLRAILGTADLPRFLTDVSTAAGLLEHGKRDKVLAQRMADSAWELRRRALGPNARAEPDPTAPPN